MPHSFFFNCQPHSIIPYRAPPLSLLLCLSLSLQHSSYTHLPFLFSSISLIRGLPMAESTQLVVEILDANDLMPKDGQGSASPFVEVEFDEQKQRSQTKLKDLNPVWKEKLVFELEEPSQLPHKIIEVTVYNDRKGDRHRVFLGRVRISGVSVPLSEPEASIQRYPLDKRGLFSHIKGDIALRIFVANDPSLSKALPNETTAGENGESPPPETNLNNSDHEGKDEMGVKKKEKEGKTFHSIGTAKATASSSPSAGPPPFSGFRSEANKEGRPAVETRVDFAKAPPPASAMHAHIPRQNPEFAVTETRPPLAGHIGYRRDKISSTYDLVEQMHYLYVNVVKARDLPAMDVSGSLDPYLEVKLGNYKGVTKHYEKNQNPVWNQIFAFSKERLQSNLLELTVKDKDLISKDDFVGRVVFDITEVPVRVPPDSPLAPEWYKLEKKGIKVKGEVMLAVWMGTQADEAFPEAWHSDAHTITHESLANTLSKVYFSPKLYYLRLQIIEAQDLVPFEKGRLSDVLVKVQLGNQGKVTKPSRTINFNAAWNEELMFVASEPFDEYLLVSVEERAGTNKDEIMGKVIIPVREIPHRIDATKPIDSRWFNLHKPAIAEEEGEKKEKFSSKIHLSICIDSGYHVLDESTHFSSDLQPSSKHLRKPSIGILELGILSARNLQPMKPGRTTDAYCVAKYGNKWVRTRTLLDNLSPRWNEQYTWEVYDPCTVITIGAFDNSHLAGKDEGRDQAIGKVRIRLSTLEANRIYTHYYPLLVIQPSGLKKHGELHLAIRFTCTGWINILTRYGLPPLPKMHYLKPISVRHIDWLRFQAMRVVAARLSRAEPPLRSEVVEYMLDMNHHMWSLRRSKANFNRIMSLFSVLTAICRWLDSICQWKNLATTILVHFLFLILVCYPELILSTVFLYLFAIGIWNYRFRPRHPPHMDARLSQVENAHPDELDEEFDTFPTSRPGDVVRMRYDRLRSIAGRVQTVIGDLATQGERGLAILGWRDPRATAIFIVFSLVFAVLFYVTPFQVLAVLSGLYWLRHPRLRRKTPSVPANFFRRLPAKSDVLL